MQNKKTGIRLFNAFILCIALSMASGSAKAGEAVSSTPSPSASAPFSEGIDASVNEFLKSQNDNLIQDCSDCTFHQDTHSTTCSNTQLKNYAHHLQRCKVIMWAQDAGQKTGFKECESFFVGKDGKLGSNAKLVLNDIAQSVQANEDPHMGFLRDNDNFSEQKNEDGKMQAMCPNFNKFDYLTRMEFHLFAMENLAYRESSCRNILPSVKGSNTAAVCAFQMEGPQWYRKKYRANLPGCQGTLAYIESDAGCDKCATEIYLMTNEESANKLPNSPFGTRVNDILQTTSYWQTMNPPSAAFVKQWRSSPKHQTKNGGYVATPNQGLRDDLSWFPGCKDPEVTTSRKSN